jgi:RNA polymerase sigma factor (sigma-70 family)
MGKENRDIQMKMVWDRMKSGDEQSLSEIFTSFYSDLYQYGIKIFNLPDLVKDSIQDVFVRIWEKRDTIGDVQYPKAYLISSVRRKLFANKESHAAELSGDLLKNEGAENFCFAASEFIEIDEISYQLRQALVKAINSLPERQRELIFLRFYYNLRYLEIAHIMEVNEQTVRNLMQRALAKLRSQIDRRLWEGIDNLDDLLLTFFMIFRKIN